MLHSVVCAGAVIVWAAYGVPCVHAVSMILCNAMFMWIQSSILWMYSLVGTDTVLYTC